MKMLIACWVWLFFVHTVLSDSIVGTMSGSTFDASAEAGFGRPKGCNQSVTADEDNWRYSWTSPNYDGATYYPDIDYECTLSITIPAKFTTYLVIAKFESPSRIFELQGCEGDRITYTHSNIELQRTLCGELGGQSYVEVAVNDAPKTFQITWTSLKDGHADVGWNMTFHGYVPSLVTVD